MAVLGRLLLASGERLDLADVLSIDSYTAGDFKYLLQGLIGATSPLILQGFEVINPGAAIGTQNISIGIANSVVLYPSSLAGPFYVGLPAGNINAQPLVPELVQNATNYVYVTFTTFESSQDARAFWDPDLNGGAGGEFTQDINTESVLGVQVGVSTASFPDNTVPIAQVVMGVTVIESIEDCRPMMFRLGSGGLAPNPFNRFNWPNLPFTGPGTYERLETPGTMSSGLQPNPFEGGDKNIQNLKQWMDAVMSKLAELGGSTYWYEDVSAYNLVNLFADSLGMSVQSKGLFEHSSLTSGQLTWTEDIIVESIPYLTNTIIRSGSKTLADQDVMYIPIVRDQPINNGSIKVNWFNTFNYVNGPVTSFQNIVQGDWVKAEGDDNDNLLRVEQFYAGTNLSGGVTTPALAQSIRLSGSYLGTTQTQFGVRTQGVYSSAQVLQTQRGNPALDLLGGNLEWIAVRSDTIMNIGSIVTTTVAGNVSGQTGSAATFTASSPHGLVTGDRVTISGSINYNGTYLVDVISSLIFTFPTTVTTPELGTIDAYYATITTVARDNGYGLQLENADHGFADDETIVLAGTSFYNGSFLINTRTSTTFTIPVSSALASASTGTATLARIFLREEFAGAVLTQGQNVGVGNGDLTNILSYIGMGSLAETHPTYNIPLGYNTLLGQDNYNGTTDDNLTLRAAQLTAMMADKAQDKTIKLLLSGVQSVTNTTSAGNQVITFNASPGGTPQLNVVLPGSPFNFGTLGMTGSISLGTNQVAYISVNRNTVFNYANLSSVVVSNIQTCPIDENVYILAIRLGTTDIWLWDATFVATGSTVPVPGYLDLIENEDRNMKLVAGGDWNWGTGTTPANVAANASAPSAIHLAGSPTTWWGQSFTATVTGNITTAALYLSKTGATGTFVYKIYSDSGGLPSTLLGTSNTMNFSTVYSGSLPFPAQTGTFSPSVAVVSGTKYHLILDDTGITGGTFDFAGSTSNPYASGNVVNTTNSGGTWNTFASDDFEFTVDGTTAGGSTTLSWSANAFIQIPGLAQSVNTILAGNVNLPVDGNVAYVDVNRAGPGGNLPITVADIASVTLDSNTVIIARRVGSNVIVGNNSMLLVVNESKPLYAGMSDQSLALMGSGVTEATSVAAYSTRGGVNRTMSDSMGALDALASIDAEFDKYLGMFRMIAKTAGNQHRVRITGSDRITFTGETLTQAMSSLRVSFTGAEIDFATGQIFGGDATLPLSTDFSTPLGINFTPTTISANNYLWYSIAAIPSGTNVDNTINVQFNVIAGSSSGSSPALAIKPPLAGLTPLGYVAVHDNGSGGSGTILNLLQANVAQLGVGAGSGNGTGLQPVRLFDPLSTTLPTGNPVTTDGVSVNAGDLVLFNNLSSGNNEVYKAVGSGTNITSWQAQFLFNGSVTPLSGNMVVITAGTGFADTIGIFTGTTWGFNNKVRYFNGADYWEVSSLNSAALANNQVSQATFASFAWLQSENMIVDYSISRGTSKETGTILITTDGTNVGISTFNVNTTGSAGITFFAVISGSNINLNYTSTNTGSAGQIKFVLRRWSDSAGGPGGIPSYSGGGGGAITGSGSSGQIAIFSTGSNIVGNTNLNYDTVNNLLELGSGANVMQTSMLQNVSIPSGVQTNQSLFSYSTTYTFAVIEYSVVEGSNYRIGTLLITQDGVSTVNVVDTFSEVGTGTGLSFASPGVTHTITGGNVNIKFNATGANIGGTFKYSMRRWS
jgi:hypothetical protein